MGEGKGEGLGEGEDMGEEMGAEGEMDMDMAAQENGATDLSQGENEDNAPEPNLADSIMRNMKRNILNEKKRVNANLMERSKHYSDLLSERLLKQEKEKKGVKKVEIYDKAFFLNEEMNDLIFIKENKQ